MKTEHKLIGPMLKVLGETVDGVMATGELREEIKNRVRLSEDDLALIRNRKDRRIDQTIRNLKSHKNSPGNPFYEGLVEDIPRGFKLTAKGRRAILQRKI